MGNLIKIELTKFIKKKGVIIISAIISLIPLLIALLTKLDISGLSIGGSFTSTEYVFSIWEMLRALIVLYIIPIYIPCTFIGREVEQRSINMVLSKEKRGKILMVKIISSFIAVTLFMIMFYAIAFISFKLFLTGTEFEASTLTTTLSTNTYVFAALFNLLEVLFVTLISVFLNISIKSNVALVLSFGVIILEKVLTNVNSIKRFLPCYISQFDRLYTLTKSQLSSFYSSSIIIYIVILTILFIMCYTVWNKRDF